MGLIGMFLGAASAIVGGISSVCSAVGGALFSGAGGIATVAAALIAPLSPTISEILIGFQIVSAIVSFIAEALGLKDKEETPEEIGLKAERSDKKPEDFDSTEAYIRYLHEEIQIDKKAVENLSPEDRAKYQAIGMAIEIKGIEEKYGIDAPGEFWRTVADRGLSGKEVQAYIENFKGNGITDMKDMSDYISGKEIESGTERSKVSGAIMDTMKELEPGLSEEALAEKFNDMIKVEG